MADKSRIIADTQNRPDRREVALQRVGIKRAELPLLIKSKDDGHQTVLATVDLSADLPHYYKGTHMSRFIEILEGWRFKPVSGHEVREILEQTRESLKAQMARVSIQFKYFVEKTAPVSGLKSVLGYSSTFAADLFTDAYDFQLGVEVPISTVCPCSLEIADIGAHNQRAAIGARVRFVPGQVIWIEDLVSVLEKQGSADIYPLLKREDEKWITEHAFRNPKFVEDVVRDCVLILRADPRVRWFEVECESEESIHQHNAFAYQQEQVC